MNGEQMTVLLEVIAACDRRPHLPGAETAWLMVLGPVDFTDAMDAVRAHYGQQNAKPALPGDIKVRCVAASEARARHAQRAIEAPPVQCDPEHRAAKVAEVTRLLAAKFSNLERAPKQRRPDTSAPTSETSPITEEARARALRSLASASFA